MSQKLSPDAIKKIRHLLALVQGAITLGLEKHIFDEKEKMHYSYEKSKLTRILSAVETGLERHMTSQEREALFRISKLGSKLIVIACQKKLLSETYFDDFKRICSELKLN